MTTTDRRIETPVGSKVGKIFAKLEILGITSLLTQSLNQPDGIEEYEETVDVEVPLGTWAVVPVPSLWLLGHGRLTPDQIDSLNDNQQIQWNSTDRPWALGKIQVSVVDINAPDNSQTPPTQTAQIKVYMRLIDYNGDDPWFGLVGFTLLCLGRAPITPAETQSAETRAFRKFTTDRQQMR